MILVDGVGSFLVLTDRQVTIGPSGSSSAPEVALMAEAGAPPTTVERLDEDYFVSAERPVQVNDRRTNRALLSNGDRIGLSHRCRLRFGLPHPASTSAVLDLSGTRLAAGDARRVILLDRDLVLGPGSSSHIRADRLADPVVLSVRDGRLSCRSAGPITVDDRLADPAAWIPMGAQVRTDALSFVVTPAS